MPELTDEQKAARVAAAVAAWVAVRGNLLWWLDFYGYKDDTVVDKDSRGGLLAMFTTLAAQARAARDTIQLLHRDGVDVTAGELRRAAVK